MSVKSEYASPHVATGSHGWWEDPLTSRILVTGGTGTLGRLVVARLRDAGREVRVLSRRRRESESGVQFLVGDLVTGDGIEPAVEGIATIIHCASSSEGDAEATQNLVRAASFQAGAPHLVYISIVGVDLITFGYMRSKLEAERIVSDSGLPWTILRVTQFYDLIFSGAQTAAKLPVVPVPSGFLVQPIDPREVAVRLVEVALGEPAGRVPDMGGPEVSSAADLIHRYLRATHRRRLVVPVWMPGIAKIRAGGLVVGEKQGGNGNGYPRGRRTWEEFLAERLS
jgi:uncharacterized protein YbjT (DUF2867 family)